MNYEHERRSLCNKLWEEGYIRSELNRLACMKVPREMFLPESLVQDAYLDTPLPIGFNQTISAPHRL